MRRAARLVAIFLLMGFAVNAVVAASLFKWTELWQRHEIATTWSDTSPVFAIKKKKTFGTERWTAMPFPDSEVERITAYSLRMEIDGKYGPPPVSRTVEKKSDGMFETGLIAYLSKEVAEVCQAEMASIELQGWGWPFFCVTQSSMCALAGEYFPSTWTKEEQRSYFSSSADHVFLDNRALGAKSPASDGSSLRFNAAGLLINVAVYALILAGVIGWLRVLGRFFRTFHMKRRVAVATFLTMLAVLTTWIVSWVCAWRIDSTPNNWRSSKIHAHEAGSKPPVTSYGPWTLEEVNVSGCKTILSSWYDVDLNFSGFRDWQGDPPKVIMPRCWGGFLQPPAPGSKLKGHSRLAQAWGWPFLAMWSGWTYEGFKDIRTRKWDTSIAGLPFPDIPGKPKPTDYNTDPMLPLGIIWPGFAVNTVFFFGAWATLLMAIAFPFSIRRRYRLARGRCPACGYDLRAATADRCPECGSMKPQPV